MGVLFSIQAQQAEPIHWDAVYQIKKEGLQNSQVMDIAFQLTEVAGPRLTASPGLQRAKEYAVKTLRELGIGKCTAGKMGRVWKRMGGRKVLCGHEGSLLSTHDCFSQGLDAWN